MSVATDTAVRRVADTAWDTEIAPGWDIAGNANGGYLLAIAARAAAECAGRPDPVTVTAHYLAPGRPGRARVDVVAVKRGRQFSTVQACLVAADRPVLALLGSFGDLSTASGPERIDAVPPPMPPPEDCAPSAATERFPPPFMGRVELRLHPDDALFGTGGSSGTPRVRGWFRLRDGEPIDTVALLIAVDAFPPTIFNANLPVSWTPTIELTAHVRARPTPGWLRCVFATRFITGGFLEEDGEVWDGTGRLVAQSRQLALVPRG